MYTWWRASNCLCFLDTDECRTEVCTSGEKALALILGVQHFHQYLYECQFTLITDHMSLTTILGTYHAIPTLAAARLQRWAITLSADNYKIQFQSMKEHANTDGLLHSPLNSPQEKKHPEMLPVIIWAQFKLTCHCSKVGSCSRHDLQVMVRGRDESVWKPSTILERRGPLSYLAQMDGARCNGSM